MSDHHISHLLLTMGGMCSSDGSTQTSSQNGNAPRDKSKTEHSNNKNSASNKTEGYPKTHAQCRGGTYPREDDVLRFPVPDDKVAWNVEFPDYEPMEFFAIIDVPIEEDKNFRLV